jgi:hypothetical protein
MVISFKDLNDSRHLFFKDKKNFSIRQIFFFEITPATLGELPFPRNLKDAVAAITYRFIISKLRGMDSNQRPKGYEPSELPLLYLTIYLLSLPLVTTHLIGWLN